MTKTGHGKHKEVQLHLAEAAVTSSHLSFFLDDLNSGGDSSDKLLRDE
jgi:hypothetical protein